MKRVFFILFCCSFLTVVNSFAQKGFYLGISGNVGASFVANQNTYGVKWDLQGIRDFQLAYNANAGFGGGLKFGYNFKPQLGVQLDIGYQKGGMSYEDIDANDIMHRKEISQNYITIRPAIRYTSILKKNYYKQNQKVRIAILFGPQIGILTKGEMKYELTLEGLPDIDDDILNYPFNDNFPEPYGEPFYIDNSDKDKDFFNTIDFGFALQFGIDIYPVDWLFISPKINTYLGVVDVNAKEYREHSGYGASKNFSAGFDLSVGFYIGQD